MAVKKSRHRRNPDPAASSITRPAQAGLVVCDAGAAARRHRNLRAELPEAQDVPFEQLLEEIPVEEFAFTQIDKPSIRGVVAQISLEAQSKELAHAFAAFHQTS